MSSGKLGRNGTSMLSLDLTVRSGCEHKDEEKEDAGSLVDIVSNYYKQRPGWIPATFGRAQVRKTVIDRCGTCSS